jgi:8-hydroxy-5-deazaflavin:NADPH oxidoreductase
MPINSSINLAVFGTGAMAGALAPHFARSGHFLTVAGRTRAGVERLATDIGAIASSWRDAATGADVILLAVHWAGAIDALTAAGADDGVFAGKVVIDCGNPVEIENFTLVHPQQSLSEMVQRRTGARVVKAFNLAHADVWRTMPDYGPGGLMVPICGDDVAAKTAVAGLVEDVGATAIDVGDLRQAVHLEAAAAVVIRHLFDGVDSSTTFNLVSAQTLVAAGSAT